MSAKGVVSGEGKLSIIPYAYETGESLQPGTALFLRVRDPHLERPSSQLLLQEEPCAFQTTIAGLGVK